MGNTLSSNNRRNTLGFVVTSLLYLYTSAKLSDSKVYIDLISFTGILRQKSRFGLLYFLLKLINSNIFLSKKYILLQTIILYLLWFYNVTKAINHDNIPTIKADYVPFFVK